jgi:hypothetical protein
VSIPVKALGKHKCIPTSAQQLTNYWYQPWGKGNRALRELGYTARLSKAQGKLLLTAAAKEQAAK